jgi:hypothetical protein
MKGARARGSTRTRHRCCALAQQLATAVAAHSAAAVVSAAPTLPLPAPSQCTSRSAAAAAAAAAAADYTCCECCCCGPRRHTRALGSHAAPAWPLRAHLELAQVLHGLSACLLQVAQLRLVDLALRHHLVPHLHCVVAVRGLRLDHRHHVALLQRNYGGWHSLALWREVGHHAGLGAKNAHACLMLPRLHHKPAAGCHTGRPHARRPQRGCA